MNTNNIEQVKDFAGNLIKIGDTVAMPTVDPIGYEGFLMKGIIEDLHLSSIDNCYVAIVFSENKECCSIDVSEIVKIA